jgi:hypothetical protein
MNRSRRTKMSEPECPGKPVPAPERFKMEAVVVCDGYADFLCHTLPHNKFLFDKIVVVTSYEDKATRKLCEYLHVECIPTDVLKSRHGVFCKGAGINVGLAALDKDAWVVHLDADIYLPPQTRILLENAALDKSFVYGCDRFIVRGRKAWDDFIEKPVLQHENECWIHLNAFPLGTRVMHRSTGGFVPIGFFQLWHPKTSGVSTYPEGHTSAGREDTLFLAPWPRSKRGFIPELIVYHLESDDARNAANWGGRTTAPYVR